MHNSHWKKFETSCAKFIGGQRFWSNSGERLDVESACAIGQCKLVKSLSHNVLSQLAKEMEREGKAKNKLGVVLHKVPAGSGNPTPHLITMTWDMFEDWFSLKTGTCKADYF